MRQVVANVCRVCSRVQCEHVGAAVPPRLVGEAPNRERDASSSTVCRSPPARAKHLEHGERGWQRKRRVDFSGAKKTPEPKPLGIDQVLARRRRSLRERHARATMRGTCTQLAAAMPDAACRFRLRFSWRRKESWGPQSPGPRIEREVRDREYDPANRRFAATSGLSK